MSDDEFTDAKVDARAAAQMLAFGPLIFQAARVLRTKGILRFLASAEDGATDDAVAENVEVSLYAARVLLEAGLVAGLVSQNDAGAYRITVLGRIVLRDRMTRVNMDFVHDVCFKPAFHLEEALETGRPAGLHELGATGSTVYEALEGCSEPVRRSWFAFDHYYSDVSFSGALDVVLRSKPHRILDVGGNTGRFARACCKRDPDVEVVLADLPGQLRDAKRAIADAGLESRVTTYAVDLLDSSEALPGGFDVVWMSQFLDCFSERQIVQILVRVRDALQPGGAAYIMETLWDRQPNVTARHCVVATSLYFAAVANGNSKMLHSDRLRALVQEAGFVITEDVDGLGLGHTLLRCVPS